MAFAILSKEEALRTTDEVHARLKKSGAEMKNTNENWSLLGLHLKNRGLAMTPDNFMRAISQLSGSLEWVKAPKPKPTKFFEQSNHGARVNHSDIDAVKANADSLGVKSLRTFYANERDAQNEKHNREALARCTSLIKTFSRNTHSKTYAGREKLQQELDRLKTTNTSGVTIEETLIRFAQLIP